MKHFDIIIIGGGASGIMCALNIENKSVLILEKQDKIGKKILVTGNGRCNLTNKNLTNFYYNTKKVDDFFSRFNNYDALNYFHSIGLETYCDSEGRYYPISNYSASVLDTMRLSLNKKTNVTILTNHSAEKISFTDNKYVVFTSEESFICDNLVFALGGDFDNIFDFNIDYTPFSPALCSFKTEKNKGLNGIRQKNVVVKFDNETYSQKGEILFKDNGISGICVFNLSMRYNKSQNKILNIDLLPNYSKEELTTLLKFKTNIFDKCENLLTGLFQKQLCLSILEKANINILTNCKQLTNDEINSICNTIKNYQIKILGLENNNQIFNGGVSLNDLSKDLEHNKYKNLFFIGEACDVSGECGGYNLQWAWTSGVISAKALNNKQ